MVGPLSLLADTESPLTNHRVMLGALALAALVPLVLLYQRTWSNNERRRRREVYSDDDDALLLNLAEPQTRWFNMGYWDTHTDSFADACAQLCRKVAQAARLEPHQRICEVGYGSGDSTLLLAREFSPKSYVGLTSLHSQCETAKRRAAEAGLPADQFRLLQGDAATDLAQFPSSSVDAVLAVDCAYHFNTRSSFLSSAHALLSPGGSIALTDLLLPSAPLPLTSHLLLRILFLLAKAPWSNFLTPASYLAQLEAHGFEGVEMVDISESVWPGFCEFVRGRDERMGGVFGRKWRSLGRYGRVVEWYSGVRSGRPKLRFYLVSARKAARKEKD
ncbi:methyltransferase type 11, McyJ-like protein [Rhodotorula toruloides]|nr:methyltransferase type 11, McyJ-like protein [Rhodotorula toruloides]